MSDNSIRVSIVVATKDHYDTLFACIDSLLLNYDRDDVEIVVHDNSARPRIEKFKAQFGERRNVLYDHDPTPVSQSENYEHGVARARGEFVTMIGDDDGIAGGLLAIVEWMDRHRLDAFFPGSANYRWPGVAPRFTASNLDGWLSLGAKSAPRLVNPERERLAVLASGSTTLGQLPRLYYGLVRRRCLELARNAAAAYFPGPSPDMANAFALSYTVGRMAVAKLPVFISGNSRESNAGLGLRGKHIGEIHNLLFLPRDTTKRWNPRVPYFWSGATIWCQSAYTAAAAVGRAHEFEEANNYSALYARVLVFHPRFVVKIGRSFHECHRRDGVTRISVEMASILAASVGLLISRVARFVRLRIRSPIALQMTNLPSIIDATRSVDAALSKTDLGEWLDRGLATQLWEPNDT